MDVVDDAPHVDRASIPIWMRFVYDLFCQRIRLDLLVNKQFGINGTSMVTLVVYSLSGRDRCVVSLLPNK